MNLVYVHVADVGVYDHASSTAFVASIHKEHMVKLFSEVNLLPCRTAILHFTLVYGQDTALGQEVSFQLPDVVANWDMISCFLYQCVHCLKHSLMSIMLINSYHLVFIVWYFSSLRFCVKILCLLMLSLCFKNSSLVAIYLLYSFLHVQLYLD